MAGAEWWELQTFLLEGSSRVWDRATAEGSCKPKRSRLGRQLVTSGDAWMYVDHLAG